MRVRLPHWTPSPQALYSWRHMAYIEGGGGVELCYGDRLCMKPTTIIIKIDM